MVKAHAASLNAFDWRLMRGKKFKVLSARPNRKDLGYLANLIDEDQVTPVIDRSFSLDEVPEAIRYLEKGHARGKVIITILPDEA